MTDTYRLHGQDDFAHALAALFPQGQAWPRDDDSAMMKTVYGLAGPWADVAALSDLFLMHESFPTTTVMLLPDWETAFGLPDECLAEPLTIGDRRTALIQRMTLIGAQDRAFFIALAASIGYTITIEEFAPFMTGVSRCGDTTAFDLYSDGPIKDRWELGPPEIRFYWKIHVSALRLTWFRAGVGECGVDPLLRIAAATDLECMLRRYKPAHTEIIFDYSALGSLDFSKPFDSGYLILGVV